MSDTLLKRPEPVYVGTVMGFKFYTDETVPANQIVFRNDRGECVGKIVNIGPTPADRSGE